MEKLILLPSFFHASDGARFLDLYLVTIGSVTFDVSFFGEFQAFISLGACSFVN